MIVLSLSSVSDMVDVRRDHSFIRVSYIVVCFSPWMELPLTLALTLTHTKYRSEYALMTYVTGVTWVKAHNNVYLVSLFR